MPMALRTALPSAATATGSFRSVALAAVLIGAGAPAILPSRNVVAAGTGAYEPALRSNPGSIPTGTRDTSPVRLFTHSRSRDGGRPVGVQPRRSRSSSESCCTAQRQRHPLGG